MEIELSLVIEMMNKAFDSGYSGCDEEKVVNDLFEHFKINEMPDVAIPTKIQEEERVYAVAELRELADGTVMSHCKLGQFVIRTSKDGIKYAEFGEDLHPAGFSNDDYPWNLPVKQIEG